MTDIIGNLGQQRLAGAKRRHRHTWVHMSYDRNRDLWHVGHLVGAERVEERCVSCDKPKDPVRSKRGASARTRGNRRELELAVSLGGEKVGHHGGPEDVRLPLLNVQSKVRKAFPYWMTNELAKLPLGRLPALIVTDTPGPGNRRRAIVVMTLEDFKDLHGRIP